MFYKATLSLAAALSLAACDLDIPDLNNPSEEDLRNDPTPELVLAATTGLLVGSRAGYAETNGYVAQLGILGRESYNFDTADPRFRSEMLSDTLNGGSPAFGGNFWDNPYANIHMATLILETLDNNRDALVLLSDTDLEAIRGFSKTIMAFDYLVVINTRDENGAALVSNTNIEVIPPLVSKEEIFDHIETLLDEGAEHLAGADPTFPFDLSSGFADFDAPDNAMTVENFIRVNRALKARVEVYRGKYAEALTTLDESFLGDDPENPRLGLGVYHAYGLGSGDTQNELVSNTLYVHPSVVADAEEGDARVDAKISLLDEAVELNELTSQAQFTLYPTPDTDVPLIRSEELLLLRAEANFEEGNLDEAIADINLLRVSSAGLDARDDLDADNFFDELAHQRRYELLFEGGHRWIDMRRWGQLEALPLDRDGDGVAAAFPIPTPELDGRQ